MGPPQPGEPLAYPGRSLENARTPEWHPAEAMAERSHHRHGRGCHRAPPLPVLGHADRYLLAEARYVGRTAAAESQLATAFGIEMHNPYTDARLVEGVLAAPSLDRWSAHRYKPLLADAVKDLLPEEVVQRGAKGLFAVDHHHGLRANEARVLDLADGHLGDLGLVRPAVLRSLLRRAMLGVDIPWGLIEPVLGAELWLRISGTATRHVRWEETA